ncbi:MAG: hypothetical protein RL757_1366 [Bacteroidota bacterium]|jgi:hypothetical protein
MFCCAIFFYCFFRTETFKKISTRDLKNEFLGKQKYFYKKKQKKTTPQYPNHFLCFFLLFLKNSVNFALFFGKKTNKF